ncbi:MAG: hypothetical protein ABIV47_07290 [Roseiflexaceae bacterium]
MADIVIEPKPADALPPVSVAALLESAMRARKNGNLAASRALLRALIAQQPNLPQVWLMLASVAETRAEQRHALERVLALDPRSAPAQRGLARMGMIEAAVPVASAPAIVEPAAIELAPNIVAAPAAFTLGEHAAAPHTAPELHTAEIEPVQAARDIRWPLYVVIGVSALLVLIAALLIRGTEFTAALRPAPTAPLPILSAATSVAAPAIDTTPAPAIDTTVVPVSGAAILPTVTAEPAVAPTAGLPQPTAAPPTMLASPLPTPRQILAPGEIVEQAQWHAILIRPEDAVALDGSIGSFQPNGRFVLALLAIGNDGQAPTRLPDDLFTLMDGSGKRYLPLPQLSTAYLTIYGRGQHGDLSMEDPIPSDGGNKSVPLIFDVPSNAGPLYLLVGDSSVGWPIP